MLGYFVQHCYSTTWQAWVNITESKIRLPIRNCLLISFLIMLFISIYFFSIMHRIKGFLSIDIDVSELQVNQCSRSKDQLYAASISANKYYDEIFSQIEIFHESNKCHPRTMVVSIPRAYRLLCVDFIALIEFWF